MLKLHKLVDFLAGQLMNSGRRAQLPLQESGQILADSSADLD